MVDRKHENTRFAPKSFLVVDVVLRYVPAGPIANRRAKHQTALGGEKEARQGVALK